MRNFNVVYSALALEDIEAIYNYISFSLKEPTTAKRLVGRIRNKIKSLGDMPERFARIEWEPWFSMSIRKMIVDNYLVIYSVNKDIGKVVILRVIYGGRNIEEELNK